MWGRNVQQNEERFLMIIGHEEVRTRQVKGTFFRYTYFNNGIKNYVYCENKETFIALICKWNGASNGRYQYTFTSVEGEPISLENIINDQNFKIKVLLNLNGKDQYIQ